MYTHPSLQNHRSCLRFEYPNVFVAPKKSRFLSAEIYNIPTSGSTIRTESYIGKITTLKD